MYPRLLELPWKVPYFGTITVYTYGVLLAAAYLLGLQLALTRAKARGLDSTRVMDLGIYIIISALVGAKRAAPAIATEPAAAGGLRGRGPGPATRPRDAYHRGWHTHGAASHVFLQRQGGARTGLSLASGAAGDRRCGSMVRAVGVAAARHAQLCQLRCDARTDQRRQFLGVPISRHRRRNCAVLLTARVAGGDGRALQDRIHSNLWP